MTRQDGERMTVHDAARVLGISEDAVRMRVKRGTLDAEREGGRLYVMLESEPTPDPTRRTEMIEVLREQVEYLRGQLDRRDEELREHRRLLAGFIERIPELEAPSSSPNATESPETPSTDASRVDDIGAGGTAPQEGARRPWWRRVFGG